MKISILGCGWLGIPLAEKLLTEGFLVSGSTTTADKLADLAKIGIEPYQILLKETGIGGNIDSFLKDASILIIDIPPKLRGVTSDSFIKKIETLLPSIEKSGVKNVIFVSSISVFGDNPTVFIESTPAIPDSESGKQLLECEQLLMQSAAFKTTIIRFGGLIGGDRHPVKTLSGKSEINDPDAPVNLIHQSDCIGIILSIINKKCPNEIFNAVAPFHPSRKVYYTEMAVRLGLALPKFASTRSSGKMVISEKIKTILNYQFQYPEL